MAYGLKPAEPADVADLETSYSKIRYITDQHKSLDFSNIGMPARTLSGAYLPAPGYYLRQYHQTRIFVYNFHAMRGHGAMIQYPTYLISANLPESLSYKLDSEWQEPLSFGNTHFNAAMQLLSGSNLGKAVGFDRLGVASGVHRATTLKIWNGSKPLSLSLEIPVIDDNFNTNTAAGGISTNLTEALEFLGCLCLPTGTTDTGFYVPPPSPLAGGLTYNGNGFKFSTTNYARIMVQLGGMLLIDRCIIKGIEVNYPKTKTLIKHTYWSDLTGASEQSYLAPLLAKVTINVETIEAMTAGNYSKMLWLKEQSGVGSMGYNITSESTGRISPAARTDNPGGQS